MPRRHDVRRAAAAAPARPTRSALRRLKLRLQQNEFAIAGDDIVEHFRVAVAGRQPFAHQNAQVVRQFGVGMSIDWFWQTMQRNSADSARALASSAGSASASPGCTASDGCPAATGEKPAPSR